VKHHARPGVRFVLLAALSLLWAPSCDEGPPLRSIGDACQDDANCASGLCASQVCVDPEGDDDGDTLINRIEAAIGSAHDQADTDGDGVRDGDEVGDDVHHPRDTDGDGTPDVLESNRADADHDCLADEVDPDDAPVEGYRSSLVPKLCALAGACGTHADAIDIACADDAPPSCDYGDVAAYETSETLCDGIDNDCDGTTDEGSPDTDLDGQADCVDDDDDDDGVDDATDNCPSTPNPQQEDVDEDGVGDACDGTAPTLTPPPAMLAPGGRQVTSTRYRAVLSIGPPTRATMSTTRYRAWLAPIPIPTPTRPATEETLP